MARIGPGFLDTNDVFPDLELKLVSGETLKLPEGIGEGYGVVRNCLLQFRNNRAFWGAGSSESCQIL